MLAVAEGDVLVGRTLDVEPIGFGKLSLITVLRFFIIRRPVVTFWCGFKSYRRHHLSFRQ